MSEISLLKNKKIKKKTFSIIKFYYIEINFI